MDAQMTRSMGIEFFFVISAIYETLFFFSVFVLAFVSVVLPWPILRGVVYSSSGSSLLGKRRRDRGTASEEAPEGGDQACALPS